mmetsp:Transcript_14070/g.27049  ORF Transcript_14070/g.27049 Transcript_14070/m.27049 type:complete len:1279 (-) Transcript_14070:136-3972(-)|eukprot:CAMPEP_0197473308 /NCGR_PEP_ID=MMETSP1309-20131121/4648_1 /TAXON_ID=464262 /ORGANISM="Genus nov. species nov., Strain RCC998" /LENGTH=1278 /DNA_ID=CAMNT_0043012359 /DNA_START=386 /DNA_END=4222 /DNA_ORIENTATION=+
MTTAAALFLATLCVLCLTSDVALAKKYLDEDGIKRDQKQREVVYPEFDEKLETDIFNALCTTPSSGGGGNETNNSNKWSLPIFCNTYSDNFTDYAQLANPATFKVRLPDDGEENSFEFYPRNKLSKSKLGNDSSDSDPCGKYSVRKNPEFCSLDDLVVIPTASFGKTARNRIYARFPKPSTKVSKSFIGKLLSDKGMGDKKFQAGVSLATSSCEQKCKAGYQCMPSLELAVVSQGTLGRCEPCSQGDFCPVGTLHDGGLVLGNARLNLCPAGFFCPTTTEVYTCPPGYFCPLGSHKPFSCDGMAVSDLELRGNYCPEVSEVPFGLCPQGYYCPTSARAIKCPEGYFCETQSMEPKPCPYLSTCSEGSKQPNISWIALIAIGSLFGGLAIILLSIALWIRISQRRVLKQAKRAEKQASLLKAIGVKLGLCAQQMSYASNLKGFSENIMLVDIIVNNLSVQMVTRGKGKLVLRGVNVVFKASSLNIILGSSGAGKTTFLKALVGKFSGNAYPSGEIQFEFKNHPLKVNLLKGEGRNCFCSRSMKKLKARETAISLGVGYVAQDNVVHEILTVHENISYSARLRLGSEMPAKTKNAIIQDTITILGLNHIQNAKVGNPLSPSGSISGGEARRVSIGLELVACPSLLILDEPTSGLDAVAANDVMSSLNKMSDLGVTVVASLHQPRYSTFLLFDSLHLFMRGGYVVYSGPTNNALDYFTGIGFKLHKNENPSDFMLDVIAGLIEHPRKEEFSPLDLVKLWEEKNGRGSPSYLKQWKSANDFDYKPEDTWLSKDDVCMTNRSQSFSSPSKDSTYDLFSTIALEDAEKKAKRTNSVMPTPRWLETLGDQFDQLDSNREGYIDSRNMLDLLESMGQNCTIEDANQIVKHFDVDGDGRIVRKDFLMRWTKNYWTREFSTALLSLFPPKGECIEVDSLSRESLSPGGTFRRKLSGSMSEMLGSGSIDVTHSSRFSSRKDLLPRRRTLNIPIVSRKSSIASVKSEIMQLFTGPNVVLRSTGGFFRQVFLLLQREPLKMMRRLELKVLDFGSVAIIGMGYAFVNRLNVGFDLESVQQAVTVAMLFVGVLSSLWGTLSISNELPMVQREASEGVSVLALFLSINLFNTAVDITIRSLAYSLPFFYITGFNMSYGDFFLITFGSAWSTSAIGILTACLTDSRSAIVLSVAISFLFGAVLTGVKPSILELKENSNPFLYWMVFPSYNRWATEALTVREEFANPSYNFYEKFELKAEMAYEPVNWVNGILFLYISGIVLRLISFGFFYRKALE